MIATSHGLMLAVATSIAAGAPLAAQQSDQPDFPTAAAPPSGDAFPAHPVQFPDGVEATPDVIYDTELGYRPLTLDIYRQPGAEEPRPLILYIHGGGWQASHKRAAGVFSDFPGVLAHLASRGYVVASAEYRLSGEAPFPAALYDVKSAIRFLKDNAEEWGIDPDRTAIWGSSAGGHLASLAALSCNEPLLDPYADVPDQTSACVDAVAMWYALFDFGLDDTGPAPSLDRSVVNRFLGCDPGACGEYLMQASAPANFVDADSPPFLLVHGDADRVVPIEQSHSMQALLEEAGVPVETHYVEGADHSLLFEDEAQTREAALTALDRTF